MDDQKWVSMNGHGEGQDGFAPGHASGKGKKLKLKVKLRGVGAEPHQQAGPASEEPEPVDVAKQLRSAQKVMTFNDSSCHLWPQRLLCQTEANQG